MKYIPFMLALAALVGLSAAQQIEQEPCKALEPDTQIAELCTVAEPEYYIIERLQELTTEVATAEDINVPAAPRYTPTAWERKLMAALAEQEDSTNAESMQAVVEVILNRIDSSHHSWADCTTAEQVIFQAGMCNGVWVEQYQGAARLASAEPSNTAFEAVDRACQGDVLVGDGVLFHAEKSVKSWQIANDIEVASEYGLSKFWRIK